MELGTASGGRRVANVVEAHPLGSVYNFYTWAEQIDDFVQEVVGAESVTLVANSIGSISALQCAIDQPSRVNGVAIVNPNFRELHVAEQPDLSGRLSSYCGGGNLYAPRSGPLRRAREARHGEANPQGAVP